MLPWSIISLSRLSKVTLSAAFDVVAVIINTIVNPLEK